MGNSPSLCARLFFCLQPAARTRKLHKVGVRRTFVFQVLLDRTRSGRHSSGFDALATQNRDPRAGALLYGSGDFFELRRRRRKLFAHSIPLSVISVAICPGSPPAVTPTPSPTTPATPTPTPTPACVPVPVSPALSVTAVSPGNILQLNAQGSFAGADKKTPKFRDVTDNSNTLWFDLNGDLTYSGNGTWVGVTAGCDCLTASVAGVQSQSVSVAVAVPVAQCSTCP